MVCNNFIVLINTKSLSHHRKIRVMMVMMMIFCLCDYELLSMGLIILYIIASLFLTQNCEAGTIITSCYG